jgi:hypothetical protein
MHQVPQSRPCTCAFRLHTDADRDRHSDADRQYYALDAALIHSARTSMRRDIFLASIPHLAFAICSASPHAALHRHAERH